MRGVNLALAVTPFLPPTLPLADGPAATSGGGSHRPRIAATLDYLAISLARVFEHSS